MKLSAAEIFRSRRLAALIDQGLVAGANFFVFIVCARKLSPDAWGIFGFSYAAVIFAQGFQRATVIIPMITFNPASTAWHSNCKAWAAANIRLTLATTVVAICALIVAFLFDEKMGVLSSSMMVIMLPPLFLMEFIRRSTIQGHRFGALILMALAYSGGISLTVLLWPAGSDFLWAPPVALAVGAVLAILIGVRGNCHQLIGKWDPKLLKQTRYTQFSLWSVMSHLGFSGYNFGIQTVLAVIAGPGAVGVFHACRTLIQPVNVLVGAMDSIDKPRAASAYFTAGRIGLSFALRRSLAAIATCTIAYIFVLTIFTEELLQVAYGTKYANQTAIVWYWGLVAMLMAIAQPIESGLYVIRRTREMFFSRFFASIISTGSAFWLVAQHGVVGALIAMAMGYAITALAGIMILKRNA